MNYRPTITLLLFVLSQAYLSAQNNTPYHLNGSATQENCNCYTLTPDADFQSGSVWNINKIDLSQPFNFVFNVFLGCSDAGADGIAFVLQPISTSVGTSGGGLGYEGVNPSIGVAIDTWQNLNNNDPTYDHIAIHRNGDITHGSPNSLAGPVAALSSSDNIEDCAWHTLRVIWNPATKVLKAQVDGVDRVEATVDLVGNVFGGDPLVYWGFTGATGGARNHQRVCTSLNPGFSFPESQITCYPEPITFIDSSASFGTIVKYYWDFGDGTVDSSATPPPHVYPAPGVYESKLRILGNNGCISEPFVKNITVGSKPIASFRTPGGPICEDDPITILDSSYVEFGSVRYWNWNINGTTYNAQSIDNVPVPSDGNIPITLEVRTREGCVSDPVSESLIVLPKPDIDFTFVEQCINIPTVFEAIELPGTVPVQQWLWNLGDDTYDDGQSVTRTFSSEGSYEISVTAVGENGCNESVGPKIVRSYGTQAFAGNDTTIADTQPLQLSGSGGEFYSWSPATGLSNPSIANPIAVLTSAQSYVLTVSSARGCETKDTINIQVFKGPEIYVPNAFTPNGDGKNDFLKLITAGISSIDYFQVYNRYGQLIYRSNGSDRGWDGSINGKQQASGTYVWMVRGTDFNGQVIQKKGTVVLIR